MVDQNVSRWKQRGKCYLWRYVENERNFPGWNFTADDPCCSSLLELVDLMADAKFTAVATLNASSPDTGILKVPNNEGGEARWKSTKTLELRFDPSRKGDNHWDLRMQNDRLRLDIGRIELGDLRSSIEGVPRGEGDFSVGPAQEESDSWDLWFWRMK